MIVVFHILYFYQYKNRNKSSILQVLVLDTNFVFSEPRMRCQHTMTFWRVRTIIPGHKKTK